MAALSLSLSMSPLFGGVLVYPRALYPKLGERETERDEMSAIRDIYVARQKGLQKLFLKAKE